MQLQISDMVLEGGWLKLKPTQNSMASAMKLIHGKKHMDYDAEIKEHRKKRSLDANAMAWVILGKLSEAVRLPVNEVYLNAVQSIGGNFEVLPVKQEAAQRFTEIWQKQGIGWPVVDMGPSKIPGYENLRCYYGSSTYDTHQMSMLINNLCEDCRSLGIETRSQEDIDSLLEGWK